MSSEIEQRARAMYEASFTTTGRSASDPQAVELMVKFAQAEIERDDDETLFVNGLYESCYLQLLRADMVIDGEWDADLYRQKYPKPVSIVIDNSDETKLA